MVSILTAFKIDGSDGVIAGVYTPQGNRRDAASSTTLEIGDLYTIKHPRDDEEAKPMLQTFWKWPRRDTGFC